MSRAASGLLSVNAPTSLADRTSVSGNTNAKNSLTSVNSRGQRLSNIITRDGDNIHLVAKEFAAIDQKVKNYFAGLGLNGFKL